MKKLIFAALAAAFLSAPVHAQQLNAPTVSAATSTPLPVPGVTPVGSSTVIVPQNSHAELIDLGQIFSQAVAPYVDEAVNALILALVGALAAWLKQRWNITIDQGHRDALVRALQNQAGSLFADGEVKFIDGRFAVQPTALNQATADLIKSLPDAAKHFGLTPDYVAKRIVDTIPQTAAGAAIVAQASPTLTQAPAKA